MKKWRRDWKVNLIKRLNHTRMTSFRSSFVSVRANSDKKFVDNLSAATSAQEILPFGKTQNAFFSVYGAHRKNKRFPPIDATHSYPQYTEHMAWSLNIYHLLGSFVGHTRCGRHIAESHKRVQ